MLEEAKGRWDRHLASEGQSPINTLWMGVRRQSGQAEPSSLGQIVWVMFCEHWEDPGRFWAERRRDPTRGFRSPWQVRGEHAGGSRSRCLVVREAASGGHDDIPKQA